MIKTRLPRRLAGAAIAFATLGALTLAGCSPTQSGADPSEEAPGGTPTVGECGSVPEVGPNDPNGLLADLPADIQDDYNGYPYEIQASAWADWKADASDGLTAAIVGQAPAAPFIATYQETLVKSLEDAGVEVVLNVAPNDPSDVPGQLQQFGQALSLRPDIIFFNAAAPEPSLDLVEQAHDAGIPVISVIASIDSPYAVTLTYNPILQSMAAASAVFGAIGGEGSVLEVTGVPGISSQLFWEAGRDKALELCPGIEVVGSVQGKFQPPLAQQAVVQYLATNPAGVDAVIQAGTMGWAIRDAFLQSGQPVPPIQDIGASQGMAAYALENPDYPYVGAATPAAPMAAAAAQFGVRMLEGAGPKINHVIWEPYMVDSSNLEEVADPSWEIENGADLSPEGVYFTDDQLALFFTNP